MATIRVLLGIIWLVVIGSSWRVDRDTIDYGLAHQYPKYGRLGSVDGGREKVVAIAKKEVGVQEYNENSSPRIDQYNTYVGFKKVPWCASFVSWVFWQAGYSQPKTAWSPALFPAERLTKNPVSGTVMGIYFDHLKRIGHCGIVADIKGDLVICVEGNTNVNGSREGDGVYMRIRHKRSIYSYADWGTN
jgi:hypothetical protein